MSEPCSFRLRHISFHDGKGNDLGGAPTGPIDVDISGKPFDLLAHRSKRAAEVTPVHGVDSLTIVSPVGDKTSLGISGHSVVVTEACMDTALAIICRNNTGKFLSFDVRKLVSFQRTIRVPDDGRMNKLPPGLGTFDVVPDDNGDLLLPMHQAEAMWMSFKSLSDMSSYAMKVGVGDVCAITGKHWVPGDLTISPQNYMVIPKQPWLDGIVNPESGIEEDGSGATVRQFVAMPIDSAASIEKQLVDQGLLDKASGGLRIEVFPILEKYSCWIPSIREIMESKDGFDMTPRSLGMSEGQRLVFFVQNHRDITAPELTLEDYGLTPTDELVLTCRKVAEVSIFVKTLTGKKVNCLVNPCVDTVLDLKISVLANDGTPVAEQCLVFSGKQLEDDKLLSEYNLQDGDTVRIILHLRGYGGRCRKRSVPAGMGIAAGGVIKQKIYLDDKPTGRFCRSLCQAVDISIINSVQFAERTGRRMHKPTVTKETYDIHGFPWFELYDGDVDAVSAISASLFNRVLSIGHDKIRECMSTGSDTCCVCMDTQNNATLADCGHTMCSDCVYHIQRLSVVGRPNTPHNSASDETGDLVRCPLCRKNNREQDIQYSSAPLKLEDIGRKE